MGSTARRPSAPPRLAVLLHKFYPVDPRVAREISVALAQGFEVDVIAMQRADQPPTEIVDGARVIRLPISRRRGVGLFALLKEYLGFTALASFRIARLALKHRYAVVHVNNPPDFLIIAALFPKVLGARVIFDIHDLSPDMFAMRFGRFRGAAVADRALRFAERLATSVADAVVTVHEPYRQELIARGVGVEKVTVVMNSVDESRLPGEARNAGNGRFRVMYHGTLTPHYGIELLVEAVALVAHDIPSVTLEIYGEGDSVSAIRARTKELGLDPIVSMKDRFLPHDQVLGYVRHANVGVIPNLPTRLNRFALSSKLFEYVVLGIPVVSADLPTIRAHFSEEEVLFFRAGDASALADAIQNVARDPSGAAMRAHAARRRYEAYRWPRQAERYATVLKDLLARRSRRI
jgi:glycosyltransferase involved in cell wall biosynthesis